MIREKLLLFPIYFIMVADIEKYDFIFRDVQGKGYMDHAVNPRRALQSVVLNPGVS